MHFFKSLPITVTAVIAVSAIGSGCAVLEKDDSEEIAAALEANIQIAEAISIAERHTGGRATEVGFERDGGVYLYEIKTVSRDDLAVISVSPESGAVIGMNGQSFFSNLFDGEGQDAFASLAPPSTTLAEAVRIAEQHTSSKAIEASFEAEDGAAHFEIETAGSGGVHEVMIDVATGKILKVATTEDDEQHDDD